MIHQISPELCWKQGLLPYKECEVLFSLNSFCFWGHDGNQISKVSILLFSLKSCFFFQVGRERECLFFFWKPDAIHSYFALSCGIDSSIIMKRRQKWIQRVSECWEWYLPSVYYPAAACCLLAVNWVNVLLVLFREKTDAEMQTFPCTLLHKSPFLASA